MPLTDTADRRQSDYFSTTNILKINQFRKDKGVQSCSAAMSDCVVLKFKNTAEYFKGGLLSKSNIYCQHKRYDSYNAIKWYLFLFAAAAQTKRSSFVLSQWDIRAKLIRWHAGQNKHFFTVRLTTFYLLRLSVTSCALAARERKQQPVSFYMHHNFCMRPTLLILRLQEPFSLIRCLC